MYEIAQILIGLIIGYIYLSILEYIFHRWPMHSKFFPFTKETFERHTILHHGRYYKTFDHDTDIAAKHISIETGPIMMLLGTLPVWLIIIWWYPIMAITIMVMSVGHGITWSLVHKEMHNPKNRWFSSTKLYKYWREYHFNHHKHPNRNFNILFPMMDTICNTRV